MTAPLEPGDWAVLTGEGCNQSTAELRAIWAVEQIQQDDAVVMLAALQTTPNRLLPRRRYKLDWLAKDPKPAGAIEDGHA